MLSFSVRVFDTSAVKLNSPPAVMTASPVISASASASEVTTVTPIEVGIPSIVGDVVRVLAEMAVDSIVTSPPAVITTSPIAILAVASDSKTCIGGGAAGFNWLRTGHCFKSGLTADIFRRLPLAISNSGDSNGSIFSAAKGINIPRLTALVWS